MDVENPSADKSEGDSGSDSCSSSDSEEEPESLFAAHSLIHFLSILYRSYGYSALIAAVLLSFLPVLLLLQSNGEQLSLNNLVRAYGWGDGFVLNGRTKVKALRELMFEQNADLTKVMAQAQLMETYKHRYETLKEKGLAITMELLEHRGKEEALRKELQKQSLALYEKKSHSHESVKKLNATYIRAFTEMKRRMTKMQDKIKRQIQVNEMLEKKLEALHESKGIPSGGGDDSACAARVKLLEEEILKLKQAHPQAANSKKSSPRAQTVNSVGKAVDVIELEDTEETKDAEDEMVPSKYRSTIDRFKSEPHAQVVVESSGTNMGGITGGRYNMYARDRPVYDNGRGYARSDEQADISRNRQAYDSGLGYSRSAEQAGISRSRQVYDAGGSYGRGADQAGLSRRAYTPSNPLTDYNRYSAQPPEETGRNTNRFMPNNCNRKAFEYNMDRDGEAYFEKPVTSARKYPYAT